MCMYVRASANRSPQSEWVRGFVDIWQRTAFKLFDYMLHLLANWHPIIATQYSISTIRSRVFISSSIASAITSWIKCASVIYYYQRSSSVFSVWFPHHQHQYHIIFSEILFLSFSFSFCTLPLSSVWASARVFWFTNMYIEMRNARGQHTFVVVTWCRLLASTQLLLLFCCHCRCGSCITTYFNIMFFLLLLQFLIAGCVQSAFRSSFSTFSMAFFAILPSFCLLFNKFIFPFVIILFYLIQCRFSIHLCSVIFLSFLFLFCRSFFYICIYTYYFNFFRFSLVVADSKWHCFVCVWLSHLADAVRQFSQTTSISLPTNKHVCNMYMLHYSIFQWSASLLATFEW